MTEVLQKGNSPTVPVTAKGTMEFYGKALGGGKAGQAADDLKDRPAVVDKAAGYANGGPIGHTTPKNKAPNPPFTPFGSKPPASPC